MTMPSSGLSEGDLIGVYAVSANEFDLTVSGDVITINAIKGEISVDLDDATLAARLKAWNGSRETIYASGALWKYAQLVGETYKGAVTHPGGQAERHVYMDL